MQLATCLKITILKLNLSYNHFKCFFSWNNNYMWASLTFKFKINTHTNNFPFFAATWMLFFSFNFITYFIIKFQFYYPSVNSAALLTISYQKERPYIRLNTSSLPKTCIISYKSGVLHLPVNFTLITVLISPTWPL